MRIVYICFTFLWGNNDKVVRQDALRGTRVAEKWYSSQLIIVDDTALVTEATEWLYQSVRQLGVVGDNKKMRVTLKKEQLYDC